MPMGRIRPPRATPRLAIALLGLLATPAISLAVPMGMYITEFNSTSNVGNREFVEFTNLGPNPINMAGWSQDDATRTANKTGHILTSVGTVQPGQSIIITEASEADFRTFWWGSVGASPAGLKIVGPYTNDNLSSSSDEVNLYDAATALVDRLTYPGSPAGGAANGVTRNPGSTSVLGTNNNSLWVDSTVGDAFGSFRAAGNNALIGNPGVYTPALAVPEPATMTLGLLALGVLGLTALRRRQRGV